jgi:hypothetical protein
VSPSWGGAPAARETPAGGARVAFPRFFLVDPRAAMTFEPIIELPYMVTGLWRHFAVHLFQGKVTVADIDRIETESARCHTKLAGKTVDLVVVLPSSAQLTHPERVRMTRLVKRWESERVASSTVILAAGMLGSVHRSVLTGLQMLVPPPHPTRVFGEIAAAVRWLAPYVEEVCGADAKPDGLCKAVGDLRVRFDARPVRAPG